MILGITEARGGGESRNTRPRHTQRKETQFTTWLVFMSIVMKIITKWLANLAKSLADYILLIPELPTFTVRSPGNSVVQ